MMREDLIEQVNSPAHYNQRDRETIDIIKDCMTEEEFRGHLKGNIIKYISRHMYKGMIIKDLLKAQWYLNRLIEETKDE